jgi:purine nucleoside phosphorylase
LNYHIPRRESVPAAPIPEIRNVVMQELTPRVTPGAGVVLLMERGEWIAEGDPPDLLLVEDQIAFLDPTIVDARGPKGEIASEALDDAERRCKEAGLVVRRGCVAGIRAIELLTPAERRAIHSLGADAVAVSIPQEVRSARAAGLEVLAVVVLKEILLDRVALVFA